MKLGDKVLLRKDNAKKSESQCIGRLDVINIQDVNITILICYSQKYFAFLKYINFKEKMLREGIILKYFSYILINITRGTQK